VPTARLVALVLLAVLLVALWWRTWRASLGSAGPRVALTGAGLALAATVLLAPVFHPWYATWPLGVLAVATVAGTVRFVLPCAVVCFLTLPDGTNLARFTKAPGALAMTLLLVLLAVRVARARPARRRLT
jgi:alpha-1,6-mannosyltransferase